MSVQKVRTFLWFDTQAEEAATFYVSLFKNSRITNVSRVGEGAVMVVEFELAGIQFVALNGGPLYHFSAAISLMVDCADQAEVDELWAKLSEGGSEARCGWIKDRFGVTWQVVPSIIPKLLSNGPRAGAVMQAMMPMEKLDIQKLQAAYDGQ